MLTNALALLRGTSGAVPAAQRTRLKFIRMLQYCHDQTSGDTSRCAELRLNVSKSEQRPAEALQVAGTHVRRTTTNDASDSITLAG